MYEISVRTEFCAAHALQIGGVRERVHGHNWHVTAVVRGQTLDPDGFVCDFHTVQATLHEIVAPFHNADLDACEPFAGGVNPSAEQVARVIADALAARLDASLAPHAWVDRVSVTEAPGCEATCFRPRPAH